MGSVRFLLILLLTVALDLSTPLPPQHGTEGAEEFEESLHAHRGRRPFRHVRDTVAPAVAQEQRGRDFSRVRLTPAPARPAVTTVLIRKLPPAGAEPSSAPEDH